MTEIERICVAELRREGAKAILYAALKRLKRSGDCREDCGCKHCDHKKLSAGAFVIHLLWALDESEDGLHFDIEQAEENARAA